MNNENTADCQPQRKGSWEEGYEMGQKKLMRHILNLEGVSEIARFMSHIERTAHKINWEKDDYIN
jgi:hypothetical protein